MSSEQQSLFSVAELKSARYGTPVEQLPMSAATLQAWQQRVHRFQQQVIVHAIPEQGSLFSSDPTPAEVAESIDPFGLPPLNTEFWRWQVEDAGVAAYYFVVDHHWPIVLYIGETVKSNQRWKGEHDCKRYIDNYIAAHRRWDLPCAVRIAFFHWAPTATRPRQQLETALIHRWKAPFNKQNWHFWSTPFIGEK